MPVLDLLLPTRCLGCSAWREVGALGLCPACRSRLRPVGGRRCLRCSTPLPPARARECTGCLLRPPPLSLLRALYVYAPPFDRVVQAFKYGGLSYLGDELAHRIWDRFAEDLAGADAVVPVPIPAWRRWQRGFNQAEVLALPLSRRLGLPLLQPLRRRHGPRQSDLASGPDRRRNARRTLAARRRRLLPRGDAVVVLVDDVVTSRATLETAARLLRRIGAAEVRAVVAGRRPHPGEPGA